MGQDEVVTKPMWETKPGMPSMILRKEGGNISYLGDTSSTWGGRLFEGDDYGAGETAIIVNRKFYILNGDFRAVYENKTIAECLEFFAANQDKKSEWSNDL